VVNVNLKLEKIISHYCKILVYRSQWSRSLRRRSAGERLLESWVRITLEHGCLSLVPCFCCKVEVPVTGRSLVQRSPTDCGVCLSVIK
jgi:hypothetical protein